MRPDSSSVNLAKSSAKVAANNTIGANNGVSEHDKVLPHQIQDHKTSTNSSDHTVHESSWLASKYYPHDCPKIGIRWFYATDNPKRKAGYAVLPDDKTKIVKPKKFSPFSKGDSAAIELSFQGHLSQLSGSGLVPGKQVSSQDSAQSLSSDGAVQATNLRQDSKNAAQAHKVPVNEDFLFDVDVQRREFGPAFWLGPVYDVRRGSWFYQEGTNLRPCDENLAGQLESGYLKVRPWRYHLADAGASSRATSSLAHDSANQDVPHVPPAQPGHTKTDSNFARVDGEKIRGELQPQRLFGSYMNSLVTYQDATTAWLLTDDFLSRMSSSVYQRLAGGSHLGGVKVIRGYLESAKAVETQKSTERHVTHGSKINERAAHRLDDAAEPTHLKEAADSRNEPSHRPHSATSQIQRQLTAYETTNDEEDAEKQNEEEIKLDYLKVNGEEQGREIEHLLLVTHGIGQKLGLRLEMLNFIRDVNALRKTLKGVYQASPDLQMLNKELGKLPRNCRVQVLPITWRHLLDFPRQTNHEFKEQDLAEMSGDDDEYPSLENITLEPSTIVRSAIRDLGLDILMYQSAYNRHITKIVVTECNRVYKIFMARNPEFKGKVSLIGHSLGSAILFDVLCQQPETINRKSREGKPDPQIQEETKWKDSVHLDFAVENYFCLGSPLGLYQMLNGCKIAASTPVKHVDAEGHRMSMDHSPCAAATSAHPVIDDDFVIKTSRPRCSQLFNIFHPADPIAYRLEPLISSAMSSLKPQPLPYTKKSIFDMQSQGLSAIGSRVGQSMSGLWSSMTTNVATSFLNRGQLLGNLPQQHETDSLPSTVQISQPEDARFQDPSLKDEQYLKGKYKEDNGKISTLLDAELETLYSHFQRNRNQSDDQANQSGKGDSAQRQIERKAKKLRFEEDKIRALNLNGRVDYSIQPGVLDMTNPMASFASHLCYWQDVDVSHFILSQLLTPVATSSKRR